jgi:hypothetical protein
MRYGRAMFVYIHGRVLCMHIGVYSPARTEGLLGQIGDVVKRYRQGCEKFTLSKPSKRGRRASSHQEALSKYYNSARVGTKNGRARMKAI